MSNEMILLKTPCKREGYEKYSDLYLVWRADNGKARYVRIRPVFGGMDSKLLESISIDCEGLDSIEKYV